MREAREEMIQSIHEANVIDKVKDIVKKKQATKIDGVLVDLFTASAISQIYDKVNPMNKKKMERLPITKLASAAMRVMDKNEYVPEDMTVTASTDGGISQRDLDYVQKELQKLGIRDAVVDQNEMDRNKIDVKTRMSDDKVKRASDKSKMTVNYEHVEVEEGYKPIKNDHYDVKVTVSDKDVDKVKSFIMNSPQYNRGDIEDVDSDQVDGGGQAFRGKGDIFIQGDAAGSLGVDLQKKFGRKITVMGEEVGLDEEKGPRQLVNPNKEVMIVKKNKVIVIDKKDQDKYMKKGWTLAETLDKEDEPTIKKVVKMLKKASGAHASQAKDLEKAVTEEDEIDEGKMSQLHQLMKDGKSAKEIAKIMKLDVKTIQALMDEKSELEEKRHIDPADIDISATDDDIKAADKNIMMQLRKSVSLRGQFPVEFLDKKKVKIPQKIAQAVIAKYNGLRKPMDKEVFQSKIAKSHRDLLMALKEGFASDAQRRAAFAQGYKAKGKKDKKEDIDETGYVGGKDPMPAGKELAKLMKKRRKGKKESTLERMNKKLQEKKDG